MKEYYSICFYLASLCTLNGKGDAEKRWPVKDFVKFCIDCIEDNDRTACCTCEQLSFSESRNVTSTSSASGEAPEFTILVLPNS